MIFTSPTGTKFKLTDRKDIIYEVLCNTGYFEESVIDVATTHLEKNPGTVIDVGANIGTVCIELATRFQNCQFHAFEPVELAYKELQDNIILNGYHNIKTYNIALSDVAEELIGEDPGETHSFGHISLKHDINVLRNYVSPVNRVYNAVTLDSYNFPEVSVLKVDVEGMEINVFKGAVETIQRCKPLIIFEVWDRPWFEAKRKEVIDYVTNLGYKLNFLREDVIATPSN